MAAAVTPLPKLTTPQAYAAFFNAHVNKGKPVAGLSFPGTTVGDQWLAFYADRHGQLGGKYTLQAYAAAFLADVTLALTNTDLQAGITGGATTAATLGAGAAQGALGLYQQGILGFLGRLSDPNLWTRALKIIIGGALLLEGIMRASGASKTIVSAGKTAAKGALL
jgi:hypothetical protein